MIPKAFGIIIIINFRGSLPVASKTDYPEIIQGKKLTMS